MNAVAGGGSFIAFPALLFTGVPAIPANATNTLSLWVGTTASSGAYPQKLNIPRRILIPLGITSLAGGLLRSASISPDAFPRASRTMPAAGQ